MISKLLIFTIALIAIYLFRDGLNNARQHLQVSIYDSHVFKYTYGCILRKLPILILKDESTLVVQIEATCLAQAQLHWTCYFDDGTFHKSQHEFEQYHVFDTFHYVYRVNLQPRLGCGRYGYYVKYGSQSTQHYTTKSALSQAKQLRFAMVSDNQFKSSVFQKMINQIEKQDGIDYVVHLGDAVQDMSLRAWEVDFFWPMQRLGSSVPLIYVPGNHDDVQPGEAHYLYTGPSHRSLVLGNVNLIQVNSNYDSEDQLTFVQNLKLDSSKFNVLLVHIPPYIEYWEKDAWFKKDEQHWGEFVRLKYLPDLSDIDLVISGHQHNYQRTSKRHDGKYFFIIGGAGGSLESENGRVADHNMYDFTYFGHFWCLLDTYSSKQYWRVFDSHMKLIDSLVL